MNNKIDAILPTIYNDFYHTKFLLKSLDKNMLCLKTLYIIVPDLEFEKISSSIKDLNLKINYELIKESFLVPKIQKYKNIKGWYKQQVIKLSAHNIITTDFFLVLDSDVILKQELKYEDLIKDNKSSYFYFDSNLIFEFNRFLIILVSFLNKSIKFKNLGFLMGGAGGFITWISGSRRILNINKKGVRYYNFTPCVLSKNALNLTINHINSNVEGYNNYYKIKFKIYKFFFNIKDYNWQDYLLINTPIFNFPKKFAYMDDAFATWAEYSVYYNFLEHKKIIDNYHFFQDHIYDLENSVWWWFSANKKINNLKIKKNNQPFIVIQSRSNVDSSLKEDFIKKFIL